MPVIKVNLDTGAPETAQQPSPQAPSRIVKVDLGFPAAAPAAPSPRIVKVDLGFPAASPAAPATTPVATPAPAPAPAVPSPARINPRDKARAALQYLKTAPAGAKGVSIPSDHLAYGSSYDLPSAKPRMAPQLPKELADIDLPYETYRQQLAASRELGGRQASAYRSMMSGKAEKFPTYEEARIAHLTKQAEPEYNAGVSVNPVSDVAYNVPAGALRRIGETFDAATEFVSDWTGLSKGTPVSPTIQQQLPETGTTVGEVAGAVGGVIPDALGGKKIILPSLFTASYSSLKQRAIEKGMDNEQARNASTIGATANTALANVLFRFNPAYNKMKPGIERLVTNITNNIVFGRAQGVADPLIAQGVGANSRPIMEQLGEALSGSAVGKDIAYSLAFDGLHAIGKKLPSLRGMLAGNPAAAEQMLRAEVEAVDQQIESQIKAPEPATVEEPVNAKVNAVMEKRGIAKPASDALQVRPEDAAAPADIYQRAVESVHDLGRGSVSELQRQLSIGYSEASGLMDRMVKDGILGDWKGQSRELLGGTPDPASVYAEPGILPEMRKPEPMYSAQDLADALPKPKPQEPQKGGPREPDRKEEGRPEVLTSEGAETPPARKPWDNAAAEDESKWYGTVVDVKPDNGEGYRGTVTRVLNGGKLVEVRPEGQDQGSFRIPSDQVTVANRSASEAAPPAVYRETSLYSADQFLPNSTTMSRSPYGKPEMFFADTPEMALGQGSNKGVLLEFDRGFELKPSNSKPGMSVSTSKEYTANADPVDIRQHLRAVTIKRDAVGTKGENLRMRKLLEELGWPKTKNADGSTTYRKPEGETPTAQTAAPEPAPTRVYVNPGTIDTPAQGNLNQARAGKARAWKMLQLVRERVKNGRANRLDLLKAEESHTEWLRMESGAKEQIEKIANQQGKTTIKNPKGPTAEDRVRKDVKKELAAMDENAASTGSVGAIGQPSVLPTSETGPSDIAAAPKVTNKPSQVREKSVPVPPKGFSRTAIEETLLKNFVDKNGNEQVEQQARQMEAGGASNSTVYNPERGIPREILDQIEGKQNLLSQFRKASPGDPAGVEDALAELGGDAHRFVQMLEAKQTNKLKQALEFAKADETDPQMQIMAAFIENLPRNPVALRRDATAAQRRAVAEKDPAKRKALLERARELRKEAEESPLNKKMETIDPSQLQAGTTFTVLGERFEIVEDADGYRLLKDGTDYPTVPADAVTKMPVDKGSVGEAAYPETEGFAPPEEAIEKIAEKAHPKQAGVFGQDITLPDTGKQQSMFDTSKPDKLTGEDARLADKFDAKATPSMFEGKESKLPPPESLAQLRRRHPGVTFDLIDGKIVPGGEIAPEVAKAWADQQISGSVKKQAPELDKLIRVPRQRGPGGMRSGAVINPGELLVKGATAVGKYLGIIDRVDINKMANDDVAKIVENIRNSQQAPPSSQKLHLSRETSVETFIRKIQDEFLPVLKAQRDVKNQTGKEYDPYGDIELYQGRASDRIAELAEGELLPAMKHLKKWGIPLSEADIYLYALHAPERNQAIRDKNPLFTGDASGMSDSDAIDIVAAYQADPRARGFVELADKVRALRTKILDGMVDDQILSPESRDTLVKQYHSYVPLRDEGEPGPQSKLAALLEGRGPSLRQNVGKGFSIGGKEFHEAKGRRTLSDSPLVFLAHQAEQAITRGEKNRVDREFYRMVEENPEPAIWKIIGPGEENYGIALNSAKMDAPNAKTQYISAKINGVEQVIEMKGEALTLARTMKRVYQQNPSFFFKLITPAMTVVRALRTSLNPEFALPNLIRDTGEASANMGAERGKKFVWGMLKGIPGGMRAVWDITGSRNAKPGSPMHDLMREYRRYGGTVSTFANSDFRGIESQFFKILRGNQPGAVNRAKLAAEVAFGFIDRVNAAIENGIRLSAYAEARKTVGPKQAASIAKNLTVNFNRKGEYGRTINTLWAFSNAGIQGNVRMFKAVAKTKRGRQIAMSIVASGIASGMILPSLLGKDENGQDRWDSIPEYEKERNIIIPMAGGKYSKLPMPYGYNILYNLGRLTGQSMTGRTSAGAASLESLRMLVNVLNPIGTQGSWKQTVSPTLLQPIVQQGENLDYTGRPIHPTRYPGQKKPSSQMHQQDTSKLAMALAEMLNSISGGDKIVPGKLDVYPDNIDHLGQWLFGGLATTAGKIGDIATRASTGDEIPLRKVPIVSRFVGSTDTENTMASTLRDAKDRAETAYKRATEYLKAGDKKNARAAYESEKPLIKQMEPMQKAYEYWLFLKNEEQKSRDEKNFNRADRVREIRKRKLAEILRTIRTSRDAQGQ